MYARELIYGTSLNSRLISKTFVFDHLENKITYSTHINKKKKKKLLRQYKCLVRRRRKKEKELHLIVFHIIFLLLPQCFTYLFIYFLHGKREKIGVLGLELL